MKKLSVAVGFTTDCMGEVSQINLEFSEKDLEQIANCRNFVNDPTNGCNKAVMWFDGDLLDDDGNESEFRSSGGELFIFANSIYYYTQSKYDGGIQVESEEILMSEVLGENIPEPNPVREAREVLRKKGFFVQNLWSSDDVIETGKNMSIEISEEQALEIMELMGRRVDASIGVNWDFIETIIEEFFKN